MARCKKYKWQKPTAKVQPSVYG